PREPRVGGGDAVQGNMAFLTGSGVTYQPTAPCWYDNPNDTKRTDNTLAHTKIKGFLCPSDNAYANKDGPMIFSYSCDAGTADVGGSSVPGTSFQSPSGRKGFSLYQGAYGVGDDSTLGLTNYIGIEGTDSFESQGRGPLYNRSA